MAGFCLPLSKPVYGEAYYQPYTAPFLDEREIYNSNPFSLSHTSDPAMPESKRNKIIIGTSGIVLGLVIAAAGLIYYKKKATGRILVPSD